MSPNSANSGASAREGLLALNVVADLFRRLGYSVASEVPVGGLLVDLVIERDGLRHPIEVIYARSNRVPLAQISRTWVELRTAESMGLTSPIIAILGRVTGDVKRLAQGAGGVRIWDAEVLLEKARPFNEVYSTLLQLIGTEFPPVNASSADATRALERDRLIKTLESNEADNSISPKEYEKLCLEVFSFLFNPYLYGFQNQLNTTDGANRYDFICRIKSGNHFWDSIRADFRTRAILFECKNYNSRITADQIYSTERYLFTGALRTVCILISRLGGDESCYRAAQGAMREAGKLILLLSNRDLIAMLRLHEEIGGPESYLDEKIWGFIATLPR